MQRKPIHVKEITIFIKYQKQYIDNYNINFLLIEGVHGIVLTLSVVPWFDVSWVSTSVNGVVRDKTIGSTDSHVEEEVKLKKNINTIDTLIVYICIL